MYQESYVRIPRPVLRCKTLTPAAKLVFGALHGYAWGEKEEAWPSIKRLAEDTGLSVRAVQYAIRNLEEHGLVEVAYRKDAGNPNRNLSNLYTLHYVTADEVVQKVHRDSRRICTTTPANIAPEIEPYRKEETNKPIAYVSDLSSDEKSLQELRELLWQRYKEEHPDELDERALQ